MLISDAGLWEYVVKVRVRLLNEYKLQSYIYCGDFS